MTARAAVRTLTGAPIDQGIEVVLGFRADGSPGVSLKVAYRETVALTDADVLENLAKDLLAAVQHLRCDPDEARRTVGARVAGRSTAALADLHRYGRELGMADAAIDGAIAEWTAWLNEFRFSVDCDFLRMKLRQRAAGEAGRPPA